MSFLTGGSGWLWNHPRNENRSGRHSGKGVGEISSTQTYTTPLITHSSGVPTSVSPWRSRSHLGRATPGPSSIAGHKPALTRPGRTDWESWGEAAGWSGGAQSSPGWLRVASTGSLWEPTTKPPSCPRQVKPTRTGGRAG